MSRWKPGCHLPVAAFAMLASFAGIAAAFNPTEPSRNLEIPLREFDLFSYQSPVTATARAEAATAFSAINAGEWSVYSWNPQTSTAHALIGTGLQVNRAFATAEDAVTAAREIVRENPAVFGAEVENLRVTETPLGYGKRSVHFQQTYEGLDVIGGTAHLIFTEGGRLFAMGSDYHRGIAVNPTPSIPASVAGEIALRGVLPSAGVLLKGSAADGPTPAVENAPKLLVLPVPLTETSVDYRLVWRVKVRTEEPLGQWATFVDAHTGEIVWRYNEVCFADVSGTTTGQVQRPSYCEGQHVEAMPYLRIAVDGVGTTYANASGNWTLPYAGSDPRPVTADLYSPYVDLINSNGPQGAFVGTVTPGAPLVVSFTNLNAQKDEKDVYRAVNDVHDFYQDIDPSYGYINQLMPSTVSIASSCNAYYVGHTINFYAEGGGCANTGEIMGVVHHEFCHGITENIIGGQGTQGIGEGNSDVLSNLMTGESIIGRGFYLNNCTSGIRNSENTLQYPANLNGQIHHDGQIIAGFHWDSWQELQAALPAAEALHVAANTWHWGRVHSHPTSQPDQVLATFLADDDNGNLVDGTPHYDAFCVGAANHGYTCPTVITGVFFEHEGVASRTTPGDATFTAVIYSTQGSIVADSARVHYRVNGSPFASGALQPTQNPNEYAGAIPGLQPGDEVQYYLRAKDVMGNAGTSPGGAPGNTWPFAVAPVVDHFEEDSGWGVNFEGTDDATRGFWTLGDPVGSFVGAEIVQPEDDRTPLPGVQCWLTAQSYPGASPYYSDVDAGRTSLYSPAYDLSGALVARVRYWRWYTNSLGTNPNQDPWLVQVRNNGGAWIDLENSTASAAEWAPYSFDLLALFGASLGTVEFKFVASDYNPASLVEAAMDEFELQTAASQGVADWTGGATRLALLGGRPNPAAGSAQIGFRLPAASRVRIDLFDVSGRQLRVLTDATHAAGLHSVDWDGRDGDGRSVPAGVYYLRMLSGGFTSTRPLTLIR